MRNKQNVSARCKARMADECKLKLWKNEEAKCSAKHLRDVHRLTEIKQIDA